MSNSQGTHQRTFAPKLESLEDRNLFSVNVGLSGSVMNVTGDNGANSVAIYDNGDGDVTVIADGVRSSAHNITGINVWTHDGNDRVRYYQTGNKSRSLDLNVDLGNDHDSFYASLNGNINYWITQDIRVFGGDGNDTIYVYANRDTDVRWGATLRLDLEAHNGHDTVMAFYQGEADGTIKLKASGGEDNDFVYSRVIADRGSSGRLTGDDWRYARVEGNDDNDRVRFLVYKQRDDYFRVSALLDGGNNRDGEFWDGDDDWGRRTTNVAVDSVEHDYVV